MAIIEPHQEIPTKVIFVHKKPDGYKTHYANGAFGAMTPRGDLEFHLFFEHREVPEEEVMNVEEGKLKSEEQDSTDVTVTRDLKVGIIMTVGQAENLGKWLLNTVDEYTKGLEANKD